MKRILVLALAGAVAVMLAVPSQAAVPKRQWLKLQGFDTGDAQWQQHRYDSPTDQGHARIKLSVQEQTGNDYALFWANGTQVRGRLVSHIRNLSYNFLNTAYQGAGSPRITVEVDTTGDGVTDLYAYLSGAYCQTSLDGSWYRADFTGQVAVGCSFYTSEVGSPNYASNGLESAWQAFEDAHGTDARVLDAYGVMDEVGQSFIDDVAFQNRMFTGMPRRSPGAIVDCPTEASC